MHIIVCIKQVPETTEVRINPETNTLMREGVKSIINPFDMYAIEEAIRLKERFGGKISVITMGPPQADSALREAISMGADDGYLVCDRAFAGSDTWATSYTLAGAIKKLGSFDLIICGKQASDGDTAQVGPQMAEKLGIPQITYYEKLVELTDKTIRVRRNVGNGWEILEARLPVLLTVVDTANEPRSAAAKRMMRFKRARSPGVS